MEQIQNLPKQLLQSAENHIRQLENLLNIAINIALDRPQWEFALIDTPIQNPINTDDNTFTTDIFNSEIFGEGKDAFIPVTNPDGSTSYVAPSRANQNNTEHQKLPTVDPDDAENSEGQKKSKNQQQIRTAQEKQRQKMSGTTTDKISQLTPAQMKRREQDVREKKYHVAPLWQNDKTTNSRSAKDLSPKLLLQMERDNPAEYYRYLSETGKNQYGNPATADDINKAKKVAISKGYNLEDYTKAPNDQNVDSGNYNPESTNSARNDGPSENEILYHSQSLGYDPSEIRAMYKNGELP
jgi:hypothetical protein